MHTPKFLHLAHAQGSTGKAASLAMTRLDPRDPACAIGSPGSHRPVGPPRVFPWKRTPHSRDTGEHQKSEDMTYHHLPPGPPLLALLRTRQYHVTRHPGARPCQGIYHVTDTTPRGPIGVSIRKQPIEQSSSQCVRGISSALRLTPSCPPSATPYSACRRADPVTIPSKMPGPGPTPPSTSIPRFPFACSSGPDACTAPSSRRTTAHLREQGKTGWTHTTGHPLAVHQPTVLV